MTFYDRLLEETKADREAFQSIPLIQNVMKTGASKALYQDFLTQAYHHVKHTCPLLSLALSKCGSEDQAYKEALGEYVEEEIGHDEWILEDIKALGGDAEAVRNGQARLPCRVMVSHAYYGIERINHFCLLGMVHVLEGMSVALAHSAKDAILQGFGGDDGAPNAFTYLSTHGSLDVEHVDFYAQLVNQLNDPEKEAIIVGAAKDFYKLYGDIFRDLGAHHNDGKQ